MKKILIAILLALTVLTSTAHAGKWFTTYYAVWSYQAVGTAPNSCPPWEIDWNGLTHMVLFDNGNVTQNPPYWAYMFAGTGKPKNGNIQAGRPTDTESDSTEIHYAGISNPGNGTWPKYLDSLVTIGHRNNVRMFITIQGVNPTNLNAIANDSAKAQVLVNTLVAWAERKKFDGVELDWEGWAVPLPPTPIVSRFVRLLYRRLQTMKTGLGGRAQLLVAGGSNYWDKYDPEQDYMVDQYNLMMYDYTFAWDDAAARNGVWHISPLYHGYKGSSYMGLKWDFPSWQGGSYEDRGPLQWAQKGHDIKKMGIGIPTYADVYIGTKTFRSGFSQIMSNGPYKVYEGLKSIGGTKVWDDAQKVEHTYGRTTAAYPWWWYQSIPANTDYYAVSETPASIAMKYEWIVKIGAGGVMTYDYCNDMNGAYPKGDKRRHPLNRAVGDAILGLPPTPVDSSIIAPPDTTAVPQPPVDGGMDVTSDSIFVGKQLITPWNSDRSWAIGVNWNGDSAVVNYSAWGGLQLAVGGWDRYVIVDTVKYDSIRFNVKTVAGKNINMFSGFQSSIDSGYMRIDVKSFPVSDKWATQTLHIPFPWYMFYVQVSDGSVQTVYFDNFILIPKVGVTPPDTIKPIPPACDTVFVTDTVIVAPPLKTPTASISSIPGTTFLIWNSCGADAVKIDKYGPVATTGHKNVLLTKTTTFVLTATNKAGSVSVSTTMLK